MLFQVKNIIASEIARIEKEREKERQQEWQKYKDMFKIEKEESVKQKIILASGGASGAENV